MIITTSDNIDGYDIEQYLNVVTGTSIYLVGGLIGGGLASQEGLFGDALNTALNHLQINASKCQADAVIGVQQSFTSPGNMNVMILAVTGTAVKIIKSKERIVAREKAEAELKERQRKQQEDAAKEIEENRIRLEETQAKFEQKMSEYSDDVEFTSMEKSILKQFVSNGEINIMTFSKILPRNMDPSELLNALKHLEEIGAICKNDTGNFILNS